MATPSNAPLDEESSSRPMSGLAKFRRLTLFAFLAVMVFAIVYDYQIARPAVAAAYDQITSESRRLNGQAGATFSNIDLQKLLGKMPSAEFTEGTHFIEVFDYPAGIPGRPHRLYAVFKARGTNKLFYRHAKFAYETGKDVATIPELEVGQVTEEDATMMNELYQAEYDQGVLLGYFGPSEMFRAMDANEDGRVEGSELTQQHQDVAEAMDTDANNVLTLAEFESHFAKMNPQVSIAESSAGEDVAESVENQSEPSKTD